MIQMLDADLPSEENKGLDVRIEECYCFEQLCSEVSRGRQLLVRLCHSVIKQAMQVFLRKCILGHADQTSLLLEMF
jgi:hypothetical protein